MADKKSAAVPESAADPAVEEAALNAELATAHAAHAIEQAEHAERDLAEATKEKASSRLCPHDNTEMIRHGDENPYKAGAWHCNTCGACWAPGLKRMREGHPAPTVAGPVA